MNRLGRYKPNNPALAKLLRCDSAISSMNAENYNIVVNCIEMRHWPVLQSTVRT